MSLKINTHISRIYFKYISESEKKILMHFKNRFKVYLKYTSLVNSWWTQNMSERFKPLSKLFSNCFQKVANFESQNMPKSILDVYFIFTVQKYIWSISQIQQDKILVQVYIIYGAMAWWLGCRFTKSKILGSKPQDGWKTASAFHPSKVNLMSIKYFWGLGG